MALLDFDFDYDPYDYEDDSVEGPQPLNIVASVWNDGDIDLECVYRYERGGTLTKVDTAKISQTMHDAIMQRIYQEYENR